MCTRCKCMNCCKPDCLCLMTYQIFFWIHQLFYQVLLLSHGCAVQGNLLISFLYDVLTQYAVPPSLGPHCCQLCDFVWLCLPCFCTMFCQLFYKHTCSMKYYNDVSAQVTCQTSHACSTALHALIGTKPASGVDQCVENSSCVSGGFHCNHQKAWTAVSLHSQRDSVQWDQCRICSAPASRHHCLCTKQMHTRHSNQVDSHTYGSWWGPDCQTVNWF